MERLPLPLPSELGKVLLLSCCAPCSGEIMEAMVASQIDFTLFFYNPNIYPRAEYDLRRDENKRFAEKLGVPFVEGPYDSDAWLARVRGLENEPERGARCTQCFGMRLERTALYAHEHGFKVFTSSLGISRWKDLDQVNACGHTAAARYEGLTYWDYNWRKNGGSERKEQIATRENFYRQQYCGCPYSLRDANLRRGKNGQPPIALRAQQ